MEENIRSAITLGGLFVTLVIFILQQRSANRTRKRDSYMRLELASNEFFRYEAEKAAILLPYQTERPTGGPRSPEHDLLAENAYLQQLNLFEISVRYRRAGIMEEEVFGSWVSWYHEALKSWWFRELWPEIRLHYTPDLREIFDAPVAAFEPGADEQASLAGFFRHVGDTMNCKISRNWLNEPARRKKAA